jgi:hypothetical protein
MSERWRHKKRGTIYEVITHDASLQCSAAPEFEQLFDDDTFTVYRSIRTGAVYIRPTPEFMDGRFERVSDVSSTESKSP